MNKHKTRIISRLVRHTNWRTRPSFWRVALVLVGVLTLPNPAVALRTIQSEQNPKTLEAITTGLEEAQYEQILSAALPSVESRETAREFYRRWKGGVLEPAIKDQLISDAFQQFFAGTFSGDYQIALTEAVFNAMLHGKGGQLKLFRSKDGALIVQVIDEGIGIEDPNKLLQASYVAHNLVINETSTGLNSGFGFRNMVTCSDRMFIDSKGKRWELEKGTLYRFAIRRNSPVSQGSMVTLIFDNLRQQPDNPYGAWKKPFEGKVREIEPPAAGLEENQFVSQNPALSTSLRQQYLDGKLTSSGFVDAVLKPFQQVPVPPPGLLKVDSHRRDYHNPSSIYMDEALVDDMNRWAERVVESSVSEKVVRKATLNAVRTFLARLDGEAIPGVPMRRLGDNEVVEMRNEIMRVAMGIDDPLADLKRRSNEEALGHLQMMERVVRSSPQPTKTAINLGVIGNALDFADLHQKEQLERERFDIPAQIKLAPFLIYPYILDRYLDLDARDLFVERLEQFPTGKILFLVDNAGEIIFDLPLIHLVLEQGHPITLVGKSLPHANDMTAEDLRVLFSDPQVSSYLGSERMKQQLHIIASGSAMTGVDLRRATPEFVQNWQDAAIIYAKGQGMIETLRYGPRLTKEVFHAVQVKNPAYFDEQDDQGRPVRLRRGTDLFLRTIPTAGLEEDVEIQLHELLDQLQKAYEAHNWSVMEHILSDVPTVHEKEANPKIRSLLLKVQEFRILFLLSPHYENRTPSQAMFNHFQEALPILIQVLKEDESLNSDGKEWFQQALIDAVRILGAIDRLTEPQARTYLLDPQLQLHQGSSWLLLGGLAIVELLRAHAPSGQFVSSDAPAVKGPLLKVFSAFPMIAIAGSEDWIRQSSEAGRFLEFARSLISSFAEGVGEYQPGKPSAEDLESGLTFARQLGVLPIQLRLAMQVQDSPAQLYVAAVGARMLEAMADWADLPKTAQSLHQSGDIWANEVRTNHPDFWKENSWGHNLFKKDAAGLEEGSVEVIRAKYGLAPYAVGVRLGGTNISTALVNAQGEVETATALLETNWRDLAPIRSLLGNPDPDQLNARILELIPTPQHLLTAKQKETAAHIASLISEEVMRHILALIDNTGLPRENFKVVHVSFPGPVDPVSGRVGVPYAASNVPGFEDYPLAELIRNNFHVWLNVEVRVDLENDTPSGRKGEMSANGTAAGIQGMIYGIWGTGMNDESDTVHLFETGHGLVGQIGGDGLTHYTLHDATQSRPQLGGDQFEVEQRLAGNPLKGLFFKPNGFADGEEVTLAAQPDSSDTQRRTQAVNLITEIGKDYGRSRATLFSEFYQKSGFIPERYVVGSGVAENFGKGLIDPQHRDLLFGAIQDGAFQELTEQFKIPTDVAHRMVNAIVRTKMDARREFAAAAEGLRTAGLEEQSGVQEFIHRYDAILPVATRLAERSASIERLRAISQTVPLTRQQIHVSKGYVFLSLPPPAEDIHGIRPTQVLYDRKTEGLYAYTEWGFGDNKKSGLTPVFLSRRVTELTVDSELHRGIESGDVVLLVPKASSSTHTGLEEGTKKGKKGEVRPSDLETLLKQKPASRVRFFDGKEGPFVEIPARGLLLHWVDLRGDRAVSGVRVFSGAKKGGDRYFRVFQSALGDLHAASVRLHRKEDPGRATTLGSLNLTGNRSPIQQPEVEIKLDPNERGVLVRPLGEEPLYLADSLMLKGSTAGLEEQQIMEKLAGLEGAAQGAGVVVMEASVLKDRVGLEEFARRIPRGLAKRLILVGLEETEAQILHEYNPFIQTIPQGDFAGLVTALVGLEEADKVTHVGNNSLLAGQLARLLPSSMAVIHVGPNTGLEELFDAMGIPASVLPQVNASGLEEQLARQRAA